MQNILLLLFLGLIASAVCFITGIQPAAFWEQIKPPCTFMPFRLLRSLFRFWCLKKITLPLCTGCILTIAGLMISENGFRIFTQERRLTTLIVSSGNLILCVTLPLQNLACSTPCLIGYCIVGYSLLLLPVFGDKLISSNKKYTKEVRTMKKLPSGFFLQLYPFQ